MDKKEQILSLCATNATNTQIAQAVGVNESYVSQLRVLAPKAPDLKAATRDGIYDSIEDKLAANLNEKIAYVQKPHEIMSLLRQVNNLKRRSESVTNNPNGLNITNNVVFVTLPTTLANRFSVNSSNEVIEVNGRSLVTMGNKEVLSKLPDYDTRTDIRTIEDY